MSIHLFDINGRLTPFFCCDVCNEPVTESEPGYFVFKAYKQGTIERVYDSPAVCVHAGDCQSVVTGVINEKGYAFGVRSLDDMQKDLRSNVLDIEGKPV